MDLGTIGDGRGAAKKEARLVGIVDLMSSTMVDLVSPTIGEGRGARTAVHGQEEEELALLTMGKRKRSCWPRGRGRSPAGKWLSVGSSTTHYRGVELCIGIGPCQL